MKTNANDLAPGLIQFVQKFATDESCRAYLEARLWPDGPTCRRCGSAKAYRLAGKTTRPGLYKCAACRQPFTVTVGTIFEGSHIPLPKWFAAVYLMCASKKGISAHQLHRSLEVTYKTAWFMCHRIRHAMRTKGFKTMLSGTVEVDETYIGGKQTVPGRPGRATSNKTAVVALVSRKGPMIAKTVERVNARELKGAIRENVAKTARIVTDEWNAYTGIGKEFRGGHETVNHGRKEYVRGTVYTNTAESFFALLKRGVHGTFHHVSKPHLDRYCDEFEFRWDNRKATDIERVATAFGGFEGKRLTYRPAKRFTSASVVSPAVLPA